MRDRLDGKERKKIMKEYIATSDPAKGGAYLRNISGLYPEECERIKTHFLSIEATPDEFAISVCPVNSSMIALCATQKKTSLEEPRMHSVSHGILIEVDKFADEFAAMESDEFTYLTQKLDEHDNPVRTGYQNERKECIVESQYNRTYSEDEKVNILYAILCLVENKQKILLQINEDEKFKWLVMLYNMLPLEIVTKLFVSTGECPMNPPDILLADKIKVQNEEGYIKKNLEQFIQYGEMFRKQTKIVSPYQKERISYLHVAKNPEQTKMLPQVLSKETTEDVSYECFEKCRRYMEGEDICLFEDVLHAQLNKTERDAFQKLLREFLQDCKIHFRKNEIQRYVDILFVAFQTSEKRGRKIWRNLWCCYDINGIKKFCRKQKFFLRIRIKREIEYRLF